MSNVILSLVEQKLNDRIARDLELMRMYINHELQGRSADFSWLDPHDRDKPALRLTGTISSASLDAKMNITVVVKSNHPTTGAVISVPRYLSELK